MCTSSAISDDGMKLIWPQIPALPSWQSARDPFASIITQQAQEIARLKKELEK